jgi:hypothetical protein
MSAIQAADVPTLNQNTTGTAANVTGIVAVANGGSGTATPSLVAGTNVTITGSWPNQTIAASGGGGGSALTISNKTGAYTVVSGDLGTIINCTANSFTVTLTAAATLGSGFNCWVWNTGTGSINVTPSGAETIDSRTTLLLYRGEGMQIVSNGTNWETGDKKTMRGYAENYPANDTRPVASATRSTAIGVNGAGAGSQAVTGTGAMALGGSYASGADSFAAGVADNTSTYGAKGANSIAIGFQANATGAGSIAFGDRNTSTGEDAFSVGESNTASGAWSVAMGRTNTASGSRGVALGNGNTASNFYTVAIGSLCEATQINAICTGSRGRSDIQGKRVHSSEAFGSEVGSAQTGDLVLGKQTADATPVALTSIPGNAAGSNNQLILPNNSAYAFTGTIIARQQAAGGSNFAAWEIKGAILRGANAASTTIGSFNINALSATAGAAAWVVALSADTTNGGLAVTVTGAAATNIRWVATVQTSEVTFA